jgi:hypothetical protein
MPSITTKNGAVVSSNGSLKGNELLSNFIAIQQRREDEEISWIDKLRSMDVKAAHPDDGWVHRDENRVHFSYPQFNDDPQVGDLIALGWSGEKFRLVKVTKIKATPGSMLIDSGETVKCEDWVDYYFEDYKILDRDFKEIKKKNI